MWKLFVGCVLYLCLALPAAATLLPVNLTAWVSNGGSWTVAPDNNSVTQTSNSPTIAFHSNDNRLGSRITGTLSVDTTNDDDFAGFVLGYADNDITTGTANAAIDYLLIDWKQSRQGTWDPGMAVSRVTGNYGPSAIISRPCPVMPGRIPGMFR